MEPSNRGVGPLVAVLVGAQVVLDQEANGLALVASEREAAVDLVEHARADLGVAVEVDAIGREGPRRNLADVVEQGGPAHQRAAHGLLDHLLGVGPHVLVLAPGLLDEVDGGLELGEQHAQHAHLLQPLERFVDVASHEGLLHRGAQARLVGLCEAGRMVPGDLGDRVGWHPPFGRDGPGDLDDDDGIRLDEIADAIGCALLGRHGGRHL